MKYNNPILRGFYPDPSIVRVDETYYIVNSSFEYLPGVPIHKSKDLIHWEPIGHCLTRKSQINIQNCPCSGGIFAPTLRFHNGIYYMITTDIGNGTFLVTADHMESEWSDPVFIAIEGYDPSLFFDEGGISYLQITKKDEFGMGIYLSVIDPATGKLSGTPKLIWRGTGGRDPEGPHIFRREEYYYLNIAEGGTREGHMITLARSRDIWGPYVACPHNPVLTNREEADNILQAIGHADYFTDCNGNWWVVALGIRTLPHFFHHLGRETLIIPVTWDEEGWPHLGTDGHVYTEMEGPLPASDPFTPMTYDDFDSQQLDFQWNFLRSFIHNQYSLTTRLGWLHLKGSNIPLNELASPTFVCRRQQAFYCSFRTLMEFSPLNAGDEAGLSIFYDNEHHFEIAITLQDGMPALILRKNVADIRVVTNFVFLDADLFRNSQIQLEITATSSYYYFNYSFDGVSFDNLGYTYTKHLSTEATSSDFVGVYCGMYAKSGSNDCFADAYFDWFSYTEN